MKTVSPHKLPYFALAATSILWGTTWVASKAAVKEIPALQIAAIRQLFAGSAFLIFFLIFRKSPLPNKKQFIQLGKMAVIMFVFANGFSTWGLKYIPTGLGALIGALYPLSVMIIEWMFFHKRNVTMLTLLGMVLGISGVVFVFYENMFAAIDAKLIFGLAMSLFATLSWSYGTILLSRKPISLNPYYGMGWQMVIGSFMLFVISYLNRSLVPVSSISLNGWFQISYLFIAGSILAFIAFLYTLKTLPATVSSLYAYVNPIVAILTASAFLGEKLTPSIFIGTIITMVGVYLVNHSTRHDEVKIIAEAEI